MGKERPSLAGWCLRLGGTGRQSYGHSSMARNRRPWPPRLPSWHWLVIALLVVVSSVRERAKLRPEVLKLTEMPSGKTENTAHDGEQDLREAVSTRSAQLTRSMLTYNSGSRFAPFFKADLLSSEAASARRGKVERKYRGRVARKADRPMIEDMLSNSNWESIGEALVKLLLAHTQTEHAAETSWTEKGEAVIETASLPDWRQDGRHGNLARCP